MSMGDLAIRLDACSQTHEARSTSLAPKGPGVAPTVPALVLETRRGCSCGLESLRPAEVWRGAVAAATWTWMMS